MTPAIRAGRTATPADFLRAREREQLVRTELPRIRALATSWRNGLAGLLAALVGFSLIKGQSDVSALIQPWAALVGVLLLLALAAGAGGAVALLRAAHGRPTTTALHKLPPRAEADHAEARTSARALKCGIAMTLICTALLAAAVGTTWYGPTQPVATLSHAPCSTQTRLGNVKRFEAESRRSCEFRNAKMERGVKNDSERYRNL